MAIPIRPKGIIFDFNGTMIFDTAIHRRVWHEFIPRHTGRQITDEEIDKYILGRDNKNILTRFLGSLSDDDVLRLAYEKEAEYRRQCLLDPVRFRLLDGLEELLDRIKDSGTPLTIATGSEILNITFYFEQFGLSRWFDLDRVVYDDGSFPGKPEPDIYLRAAAALGLDPAGCLVFEDSLSGVLAAHNAGIGYVVAISETENAQFYAGAGGVELATDSFREHVTFLEL